MTAGPVACGEHGARPRRRGRKREKGSMVPAAEFQSYYGRPILKPSPWKSPDIPGYFFSGGLAGASALLAPLAEATGRPRLARVARRASVGGALVGTAALVHDLGRPARFLYMLRVVKWTSPLSVGTWILSPFAALATASLASAETGIARPLGRAAGIGAAALGPALSTYTAVLVADTAIPAWHEARRELPLVFAGSSAAAAGGLGLLSCPAGRETEPARRLGVGGAALELLATELMERRLAALPGGVDRSYRDGRAGPWMSAARWLLMTGMAGALAGRRSRLLSAAAGVALLGGSLATRFGVFHAGSFSAAHPDQVVGPQRERLAARVGDR